MFDQISAFLDVERAKMISAVVPFVVLLTAFSGVAIIAFQLGRAERSRKPAFEILPSLEYLELKDGEDPLGKVHRFELETRGRPADRPTKAIFEYDPHTIPMIKKLEWPD
jgi:hypothetical protein